jgi:ketosteroid isomerase-like protein
LNSMPFERPGRALRIILALSAVTVPLAVAGPAWSTDEKGNNGNHYGQLKQEEQAAAPTARGNSEQAQAEHKPAKAQKPAKAEKPAKPEQSAKAQKPAKTEKPAKAPKSKAPATEQSPSSHAKAGKTTICHATGSETNPYVTITISNNAIPAHDRHQHDEDIIPAPAGGCPGGAAKADTPKDKAPKAGGEAPKANEHGKTTICHATGSETNPYVTITISNNAIPAHDRHQHDEDIIPAPAGGCPAAETSTVALIPETKTPDQPLGGASRRGTTDAATDTTTTTTVTTTTTTTTTDTQEVAGENDTLARNVTPTTEDEGGVLGEVQQSDAPVSRVAGADAGTAAATGGQLPFTGADLIVLVLLGLATLLGGVALRRSIRNTRRQTL